MFCDYLDLVSENSVNFANSRLLILTTVGLVTSVVVVDAETISSASSSICRKLGRVKRINCELFRRSVKDS